MENKTALQLVIDELTTLKNEALELSKEDRNKRNSSSVNDSNYVAYSIAINVVKKKLEQEKSQIIEAAQYAINEMKANSTYYTSPEQYFENKFN